MKLVLLSSALFVYGCFCDICIKICEKIAENRLKKGRTLTGKGISALSNFTNNRLLRWNSLEQRVIHLFLRQNS